MKAAQHDSFQHNTRSELGRIVLLQTRCAKADKQECTAIGVTMVQQWFADSSGCAGGCHQVWLAIL